MTSPLVECPIYQEPNLSKDGKGGITILIIYLYDMTLIDSDFFKLMIHFSNIKIKSVEA